MDYSHVDYTLMDYSHLDYTNLDYEDIQTIPTGLLGHLDCQNLDYTQNRLQCHLYCIHLDYFGLRNVFSYKYALDDTHTFYGQPDLKMFVAYF